MYLAELELHGFKSFAQKTSVKFGNGITAIVGPNGCGKSNIVDALRWALGEQRPSLLRSSAMTNVIFNGTATKKALGLAEVSITIENNKGILPSEFSDITITRRLYRSGDSEYLLNRVPCRLKDIVELFMDTGMGSNAYSVIELKMVEEILADKNNDRRKLFEEAAGVTKYKEKRKQTMRKLDETRTDMLRIEDILVEIRKKVKSLQIQAGRAQRAKQYEEDLQKLDKALSGHDYRNIQSELGPLMERILNADKEKEELSRNLETLEKQLLVSRDTLTDRETEQGHAMRLVSRLSNEIRDAETTITISNEKIVAEQNVIDQYENDVVMSEGEIKEFRQQITRIEKLATEAETRLKESTDRLEIAREALHEAREEVAAIRRKLEEVNTVYRDTNVALQALQNKKIRLESRLEGFAEDKIRIEKQLQSQLADVEQFGAEDNRLKFALEQALEATELAEARHEEAVKERERLSEQQTRLKDQQREMQSKRDALRSEINLLESIAKSDEAFPGSVKYLRQFNVQFTRFDLLSELFSVPEELAVALESVLGDAVNYIVMDSVAEAEKAFEMLKKEQQGKATIIPMELLTEQSYELEDGSLAYEVRCAPKFEPLRNLLLGQTRVYETLDEAVEGVRGTRFTGVTRQGELVSDASFLRGGSSAKNEGLRVGLRERIDKLIHKADGLDVELDRLQEELAQIVHLRSQLPVESLAQQRKEAEAAYRKLESERSTFQARKQVYEKNIADIRERQLRIQESHKTAREELESFEPEAIALEEKLEQILDEQHRYRADLQQKEDSLQRVQSRFSEAQLDDQKLQNEVNNHKIDIERAHVGIAGIKKRLESRAQSARDAKDRILSNKQQIEELTYRLEGLRRNKGDADEALTEAEESAARQRGRINQIDEDLREIRRKREINTDLVHHLTMAKERFDMQLKSIADHIWETYGLLMDQLTEEMPDDTEPATVKETIKMLRERLKNIGEVNKLAIEEYEEEKTRLDTFESQMQDLNEAETKLRETIAEINDTANKRFTETFDEIRTNFRTVFHTLFDENDHCDLILDDNAEDPLDRKIHIIANPRGKRPSNIEQLSGGEKTLTAIALLFAIYLVKPSPFCILDEVDAPLDDANVGRFTTMIKKFSKDTQFIIITHNKNTMEKSEMLYGVTMPETGVSKLVAVKMEDAPV
ncbi:MAG: chromosome segregation protein SMC [Bacteroidetes bacterium]|nr:chromosome segregation protein SMC [Bacteroidota bacterium]